MALTGDITNIFLFLNLFIGIFAIYKSLLNYYTIRSLDYLLIAAIFFAHAFFAFLRVFIWPTWLSYLGNEDIGTDPRFYDYGLLAIFWQTVWVIGIICYLIHCYGLVEWRKRPRIVKGVLIIFFVEALAQAFYYVISIIHWFYLSTEPAWQTPNYATNEWYLQLWLSHFLVTGIFSILSIFIEVNISILSETVFPGLIGVQLGLAVVYLLVAISYAKIKPVKQTKPIKNTRIAWVLFGSLNFTSWVLTALWNTITFVSGTIDPGNLSDYQNLQFILELLALISMIGIMIILSSHAESFLITKTQILQAKKLYNLLAAEPEFLLSRRSLARQFLSTEANLVQYLKKIPPEIITQLEGLDK